MKRTILMLASTIALSACGDSKSQKEESTIPDTRDLEVLPSEETEDPDTDKPADSENPAEDGDENLLPEEEEQSPLPAHFEALQGTWEQDCLARDNQSNYRSEQYFVTWKGGDRRWERLRFTESDCKGDVFESYSRTVSGNQLTAELEGGWLVFSGYNQGAVTVNANGQASAPQNPRAGWVTALRVVTDDEGELVYQETGVASNGEPDLARIFNHRRPQGEVVIQD